MHMALSARRWTRADLERLPEDGNSYEVVDGELFVVATPSIRHERIKRGLAKRLGLFVEQQEVGDLYDGRPCFVEGDNQVEPDLLVSTTPLPLPEKWDDMPRPSLVVEVLSPSTARHDRVVKRDLYRRAGIVEYWIVDGESRSVEVVTPTTEQTIADRLRWKPAGCAASLEIDLLVLFAEAFGEPSSRGMADSR